MNPFISATRQFFKQIWADAMLFVLLLVPLIMGILFCFGVPALESFLCHRLDQEAVLSPYYAVFDLLLSAMTPIMSSAAGALVILDEVDAGISLAYITSPVGRAGYLLSRIGVTAGFATVYCVLITAIFQLSGLEMAHILLLSLCSGSLGMIVALMVPALAKNRVEGMAISKLSGLIILGVPAALLLPSPISYLAGFLPSFWMTELVMGGSMLNVFPAIFTSALFLYVFLHLFNRRIL